VYVLDVGQRRCVEVLRSGHRAGSLRGEPLLVRGWQDDPKGGKWRDLLLLRQEDTPGSLRLRAPAPPEARFTVAALPSLPAYHDGERVIEVTDAGVAALFGINQPGNRDPLLFRLTPADIVAKRGPPTPGLLAHATEHDLWVLARGTLARLRLGADERD